MSFEFPLPDVGEGLTEADIVAWKVAAGDTVTVNQILVEIETAKSLVELPSPQAGTIDALLVDEGQTIEVGTPIIRFSGGESGAEAGSDGASETGGSGSDSGGPAEATSTEDADGGGTLVGYGSRTARAEAGPPRRPAQRMPTAVPLWSATVRGRPRRSAARARALLCPPRRPHPLSRLRLPPSRLRARHLCRRRRRARPQRRAPVSPGLLTQRLSPPARPSHWRSRLCASSRRTSASISPRWWRPAPTVT